MPKTKTGEIISWKEFFKKWKAGIEGLTPYQQTKGTLNGTYISLLGIIFGIIASAINFKTLWWVIIILIGAFIVTFIQIIGLKQKLKLLAMMEGEGR